MPEPKRSERSTESLPADSNENFVNVETEDRGIVGEFVEFLRHNKKWWITPIVVVAMLLVVAALMLPSPVAPFIYSLF